MTMPEIASLNFRVNDVLSEIKTNCETQKSEIHAAIKTFAVWACQLGHNLISIPEQEKERTRGDFRAAWQHLAKGCALSQGLLEYSRGFDVRSNPQALEHYARTPREFKRAQEDLDSTERHLYSLLSHLWSLARKNSPQPSDFKHCAKEECRYGTDDWVISGLSLLGQLKDRVEERTGQRVDLLKGMQLLEERFCSMEQLLAWKNNGAKLSEAMSSMASRVDAGTILENALEGWEDEDADLSSWTLRQERHKEEARLRAASPSLPELLFQDLGGMGAYNCCTLI